MRRTLFLSITMFLGSLTCYSQELPSSLCRYREACYNLIEAIENNAEKSALYEVQEELEGIVTADFSTFIPADEATRMNKEMPVVMFTPEYVDTFIVNNCRLVELDSPSLLRGNDEGEIYIQHAAIAPGATLAWKSEGCDFCAMLMVWYPQAELTFTVTDLTTGKIYGSTTDSRGQSATAIWQMPPQEDLTSQPNFVIQVCNKSNKKASFVVAMN